MQFHSDTVSGDTGSPKHEGRTSYTQAWQREERRHCRGKK